MDLSGTTKWAFYRARKLRQELLLAGHSVDGRHVKTLVKRMEIKPIYRKPRTSIPEPLSAVYPYLLSGLTVSPPNQVWAADLTSIPMAHEFEYLVAIIDLCSRKVMA